MKDVCEECQFPAEIGAYKHLKAVKVRHTLFKYISWSPMMVKEILAERKDKTYRILALVVSTQASSIGKAGPVIEIIELKGPHRPNKVIYQLKLEQIYSSYSKLNRQRAATKRSYRSGKH